MANKPTYPEYVFWYWLKDGVLGFSFKRQVVLYGYIADFYCKKLKLAIELDGNSHDPDRDRARDNNLAKRGIKTLRFNTLEAAKKPSRCLKVIRDSILQKIGRPI